VAGGGRKPEFFPIKTRGMGHAVVKSKNANCQNGGGGNEVKTLNRDVGKIWGSWKEH